MPLCDDAGIVGVHQTHLKELIQILDPVDRLELVQGDARPIEGQNQRYCSGDVPGLGEG